MAGSCFCYHLHLLTSLPQILHRGSSLTSWLSRVSHGYQASLRAAEFVRRKLQWTTEVVSSSTGALMLCGRSPESHLRMALPPGAHQRLCHSLFWMAGLGSLSVFTLVGQPWKLAEGSLWLEQAKVRKGLMAWANSTATKPASALHTSLGTLPGATRPSTHRP